MSCVRMGLVGSGGMASHRAAQFAALPDCRLVALAARNRSTAEPLAQRYGLALRADWRELVARPDLDAVAICATNDTHGPVGIAALEAGKHVFTEYPLARRLDEAVRLLELSRRSGPVLWVAHEPVPDGLDRQVAALGPLLDASFVRLTPGRGARPEVLFNLPVSGPPALFFVYHVYPVVALFGPAAWATAAGAYTGLDGSGRYDSFVNTVTAGFVRGGLGQWTWAGGVEIERAEEYQRWVLHRGTLRRQDGRWEVSTRNGASPLELEPGDSTPAAQQFLAAVRGGSADWRSGVRTAFEAARLGLAAETAMSELRRVDLPPCT